MVKKTKSLEKIEQNHFRDTIDKLNYQQARSASYGAMLLAVIAFITLSILQPFSLPNILAGICILNTVFDNFLAERLFGYRMKQYTDIYCVLFMMLSIPVQWFYTGGFVGVGGLWMIFTAVYCIYGINGKIQHGLLIFFAIEVNYVLWKNYLHPEIATSIEPPVSYILCIVSILIIGLYIQVVEGLQKKEVLKDRENLELLQEDLTAHYEESIAMNDELMRTTERLELANKTQKSFTASMNHELRSPLNGIEGCLQILLMNENLSEEGRETVKNALTASKTINQTVNDLLDFAKLDEGKFEITQRQFDLREVLDNIATIFRPQALAKNLNFTIQIPKDARVSIVSDGVRIQQIMTNLISNAIKYTSKGNVTMSVATTRGHLTFDVKDTGQGMSEESLKVLFDPFTRFNLHENNHIQGIGLGMNIVSNMVKAMNGSIRVESTINEGTTFFVDLPILFYDSEITYSSPKNKEDAQYAHVDLSCYKVLCVDDTMLNRTIFKGLMKNTGADIVLAESGKRALHLCKEQNFDIIFLDHMMPEMDGIETLQAIRSIEGERFKDIPLYMFTGNTGEDYLRMYKENGANGYVGKPVMYADIIRCFLEQNMI